MTAWPDWTNEAVAIVASGPSATKADVALLKGRVKVVAIKKSIELVPFADVLYGCDAPWWRSVLGMPSFKGLKLSYDDLIVGQYGIEKVHIEDKSRHEILMDQVGYVGSGGNSGFQAFNLVLQWHARKIMLVGFDANGGPGREHWYGRNTAMGMRNPDEQNYRRWIDALEKNADFVDSLGAEVINTSQESRVRCFPKMSVKDSMERWGI